LKTKPSAEPTRDQLIARISELESELNKKVRTRISEPQAKKVNKKVRRGKTLQEMRRERDVQVAHAKKYSLMSPAHNVRLLKPRRKAETHSLSSEAYSVLQRSVITPKVSQGGLPGLGKKR
jgi:hypothetical protein